MGLAYRFQEFLEGKSDLKIAKGLEHDSILTGAGKTTWWVNTIKLILKNEKYMGDALLQKTHTVDFLTKKRVKNNGIVQQYYVEDSHPAIINKEGFAAVQAEFERRSSMRGGAIHRPTRAPIRVNMPFPGSFSAKTAARSLEEHLGAPGKISSMCGDALTQNRTEWIFAAQNSQGEGFRAGLFTGYEQGG
jgi:site-specific DNA recombinase